MNNLPKIGWDSTIIIDALQKDAKWWPEVEPMYSDAVAGKIEIVVSEISVAESCRLRALTDAGVPLERAVALVKSFFNNRFIKRRPVSSRESELAADVIRIHNLETCDAIIAATASIAEVQVLYSRDGMKRRRQSRPSLLKCDGLIGTPPLAIKPPSAAEYLKATLWIPTEDEKEDDEEEDRAEAGDTEG